MKTLRKYSEAVFLLVLFVYACISLWYARGITGIQQPGEFLTPKMYVLVLGGIFALLCAVNLAVSILKNRQAEEETGSEPAGWNKGTIIRTTLMMSLGFLFVIGMKVTGFYITAFLVMAAGYLIIEGGGKKNLFTAMLFSLCICGIFYFVFRQFHIYLPKYLLEGILKG